MVFYQLGVSGIVGLLGCWVIFSFQWDLYHLVGGQQCQIQHPKVTQGLCKTRLYSVLGILGGFITIYNARIG